MSFVLLILGIQCAWNKNVQLREVTVSDSLLSDSLQTLDTYFHHIHLTNPNFLIKLKQKNPFVTELQEPAGVRMQYPQYRVSPSPSSQKKEKEEISHVL